MSKGRQSSDSEELEELVWFVHHAVVAAYPEMWPEEEVIDSRLALAKACGRVPTLEELGGQLGHAPVKQISAELVRRRATHLEEMVEQMAEGDDCHLCGAARRKEDPYYEFAVAIVHGEKHEWGRAAGVLALNAITMPFGVGVGMEVGTSYRASIARCRLALCDDCATRRRGFFGGWKVTQEDCSNHPSWERLLKQGYSRYLNHQVLAEYKIK